MRVVSGVPPQPVAECAGARGYWDYEQFEHQAVAVLDTIEALHKNHQVVLEVDWSQGHAKKSEGGLYVSDMNSKWGTTRERRCATRSLHVTA